MIETAAIVINDARNDLHSEPCEIWIEAAQDQLSALGAILGEPDGKSIAARIAGELGLVVQVAECLLMALPGSAARRV